MKLCAALVPCLAGCLACGGGQAASDRAYDQGLAHLGAEQWTAAAEAFQRVLRLAPDSTSAQVRLGEIYLRQGRRSAAEEVLSRLGPLERRRPGARLLQARLLAFGGRALEARALGEEVLAAEPGSTEARLLLAEVALQAAATMDLERAAALCRQVLEENPRHKSARRLLVQAELRRGEFAAALEQCKALIALDPDDGRTHLLEGTAALWAGDPAAARILQEAVDRVLDDYPERLKALWLLKLAYQRRGGYPSGLPERYRFHTSGSTAVSVPVRFTDIGAASGTARVDRGRGSAWLDYDLDGDFDLFTVGIHSAPALYRNDGGERFAEIAAASGLADGRGGWGASTADYDNDGDADLFVTRDAWEGRAPNSLYRNEGARFVEVAPRAGLADSASSFTATWLDYDLDGYLDLYVANGVIGDGEKNNLLLNRKNGTFIDGAAGAGVDDAGKSIGTASGDYDGDGFPDLYLVDIGAPNRLYHNEGDGTFADKAPEAGVVFPVEGGYVTFFFDYDNDGELDLFASTMSAFADVLNSQVEGRAIEPNRPFLYHNEGDGTFSELAVPAGLGRSFGSMGIGVGDVNNDGFADIYLANGGPEMYRLEPNVLFLNQGDGHFADITEAAGVGNLGKGHGATFADFDGDGDLDLYAGTGGHYDGDVWANSLYRNEGRGGHFLEVETVGTLSNRSAIGARVAAFAGAHVVRAQVASGFGFGSSNALPLHLGLGSHRRVDRLEIRWPSGRRQHWENLPADCTLRLTEGEARYVIVRRIP